MRVFISSVIAGFAEYRDAARRAVKSIGDDVIMAEDFGASPDAPQLVCLQGVRNADAVVLVLGSRYGDPQPSGLSATHEEYREARDRGPMLVFIQAGVQPDPKQAAFIQEVQAWSSGHYTERFSTPDELRDGLTAALHQLALASAMGRVDDADLLARARVAVPSSLQRGRSALWLVVTGGPRQQALRPAELEGSALDRFLKQLLLFGDVPLFSSDHGTNSRVVGQALLLTQEQRAFLLDELGTVGMIQPIRDERAGPVEFMNVVIAEDLRERIAQGLRLVGQVLDHIDPVRRLSDVLPVATLVGVQYSTWRTRAEHVASPHSATINMDVPDRVEATLAPPTRRRAALLQDIERMSEDLLVQLRRSWR